MTFVTIILLLPGNLNKSVKIQQINMNDILVIIKKSLLKFVLEKKNKNTRIICIRKYNVCKK